MMIPSTNPSFANSAFAATGTLYCTRFHAEFSMPSITRFYVTVIGTSGSGTVGAALYTDDDSGSQTRLATTGGVSGASGGVIATTGITPFAMTKGTVYRICGCTTDTGAHLATVTAIAATGGLGSISNVVTAWVGTAANSCSSGVPPATTGAITGTTTSRTVQAIVAP